VRFDFENICWLSYDCGCENVGQNHRTYRLPGTLLAGLP
jgi:hypothetical protein